MTCAMIPQWAVDMKNCSVTVCDADANIIFMNELSKQTFAGGTDRLIGTNLRNCHSPRSWEIICKLLETGGTNAYTIEKNGKKKMIYQTAWCEDGQVKGLVELSLILPEELPHYVR